MKVYFITRFSIYDPNFRGFRLSVDYNDKEYESRLFSKNRLNHKFDIFENITVPSIAGQSNSEWIWLIYTSVRMPEEYMKRLDATTRRYPSIHVITVEDFTEFFEKDRSYNYSEPFATVRIDDDDALNACFVEKLQQYSGNVGSIISFTEGRLVKYSNGLAVTGEKISDKNNALGLAGIGLPIYNCGRHSDIDKRYNVIYDSTPNMFLMTCSPFTDTKRGFTQLDRNLAKFRRLVFLLLHRPNQAARECLEFARKRIS